MPIPGWLVLAILMAIIALVSLLVRRGKVRKLTKLEEGESANRPRYGNENVTDKVQKARGAIRVSKWVLIITASLAVFSLVLSCFAFVSTKNVGVVTTFGRPTHSLSNGLHPKAPWQKVSELDGAIQTDKHVRDGKNKDGSENGCTYVRIAHQSVACVDNSISWRIQPTAGDRLFRDYKNQDNIRANLVTRELSSALNTVLKDYDPLAADANGNSVAPSQDVLSKSVTEVLGAMIGTDIEVRNVVVPIVHYDDQTQKRIDALQAEVANTRIATQREKTAEATAAGNRKLASSVSKDPNVIVSTCFDNLAEMIRRGQQVPAGFSCWPGGQSAVVIPSGK